MQIFDLSFWEIISSLYTKTKHTQSVHAEEKEPGDQYVGKVLPAHFAEASVCLGVGSCRLYRDDGLVDLGLQLPAEQDCAVKI